MKGDYFKRNKKAIYILFIIYVLVGFGYIVYECNRLVSLYEYRAYPSQKIESIYIDGLDKQEIEKVIYDMEKDFLNKSIKINIDGEIYSKPISFFDAKIKNREETVKRTIEYRKDDFWINKAFILILNNVLEVEKDISKNYSLEFSYNEEKIDEFIKDIADSHNIKAKEPSINMYEYGVFEIKEGKDGREINIDELEKMVSNSITDVNKIDEEIYIESIKSKPKYTKEDIDCIDSKISSYTTIYSTGTGRAKNVEIGAERINGTLLMPGESFSLNKVVLARTRANGYKTAPEYRNGKVVDGVGGGICQVSTTVYGAQLRAGILPIERHPHSMTVSYAPIGLDAAIAGDILDLKFENPYDYPVYIYTNTSGGRLTVEFWSNINATNGIRYEPKSYAISALKANAYLYGYDEDNNRVFEKELGISTYRPKSN